MNALLEMPVQDLLRKVEARGVQIQANGDHLSIGWPEKTPDPEIRQAIIERKPEILEALSLESGDCISPDHFSETEQEYYFNLLEIMQSPKFGLSWGAAEREAKLIIDEYRLRKKQRIERNLR